MRTATICAGFCLLMLCACLNGRADPVDPPPIEPALQAQLSTWPAAEGRAPTDYLVSLFPDHDVVFLGEYHRVKHDVLLVQSLIEPLYAVGVRVLATEFGRREDQADIDRLIGSAEWNEYLARDIVFRQFVFWGFREYVGVYKSAWKLNRTLPADAPRFRILGINDSPDWSHVQSAADRDNPEIMRKVWDGGGELHWAGVILDAVAAGEKVLVYCGIHHAFTEYRQPIVVDGAFLRFDTSLRCGNHVYAALGKRAVTVNLHAAWGGPEGYGSRAGHPADGVIDAIMLAEGPRPVGFDLDRGPFGELRVEDAVYRHGYEDFKLADFCDGWIYTQPLSRSPGVTPIPDWMDERNLERAQAQSPNPGFRRTSIEDFNESIARDAAIERRWAHLR